MSLYKDPSELRDHFRVEVIPDKPAYLVLAGERRRIEISDLSAGGFAMSAAGSIGPEFALRKLATSDASYRGTLYVDLEEPQRRVGVDMDFKVVSISGQVRCEIIVVAKTGRDQLFTYVFENELIKRSAEG